MNKSFGAKTLELKYKWNSLRGCLEEDDGLGKRGCLKKGLVCSAGTYIRLTTQNGYEFFVTVGRDIKL